MTVSSTHSLSSIDQLAAFGISQLHSSYSSNTKITTRCERCAALPPSLIVSNLPAHLNFSNLRHIQELYIDRSNIVTEVELGMIVSQLPMLVRLASPLRSRSISPVLLEESIASLEAAFSKCGNRLVWMKLMDVKVAWVCIALSRSRLASSLLHLHLATATDEPDIPFGAPWPTNMSNTLSLTSLRVSNTNLDDPHMSALLDRLPALSHFSCRNAPNLTLRKYVQGHVSIVLE